MAPVPVPKGGGGKGGGSGGGGGGGVSSRLTPTQTIAIVLGIFIGPIILYIMYDITRGVIRVFIKRRTPRQCQDGEQGGQPGVPDEGTSMPAAPTIVAPMLAAHLPAAIPTLPSDAIINYRATPRASQDKNPGDWTAEAQVYDPDDNQYLAARMGSPPGDAKH
ncbi:hypothetical protein BGX38DRAFT_1241845 [Terfezia claveryi]|nr:hypothetical protein BGX38DRAFT_1241845 [Terfezia claveryi]